MNSTQTTIERGTLVCRPTNWTDIVRFYLLNYALHALTVSAEPGSTWISQAVTAITAVFMPSVGIASAFQALYRASSEGKTDLEVALKFGALCMLVPADRPFTTDDRKVFKGKLRTILSLIIPQFTHVHGRYPETKRRMSKYSQVEGARTDPHASEIKEPGFVVTAEGEYIMQSDTDTQSGTVAQDNIDTQGGPVTQGDIDTQGTEAQKSQYYLIQVPHWFRIYESEQYATVEANKQSQSIYKRFKKHIKSTPGSLSQKLRLTSNHSAIKSVAAILQILYGCFELYRARGDQLERYGYATYSLTVIPYVLMSVMNLLASISGPQYPSMFIVNYRGEGKDSVHTSSTGNEVEGIYPKDWWNEDDRTSIESQVVGAVGVVYGKFWEEEKDVVVPAKTGDGSETKRKAIVALIKSLKTVPAWEALPGSLISALKSRSGKGVTSFIMALTASITAASKIRSSIHRRYILLIWVFSISVTVAPYVIIAVLTGFQRRNSTRPQRIWIMCWIVVGQVGATIISTIQRSTVMRYFEWQHRRMAYFTMAIVTVIFSVATVGGFVVVAQMMIKDQVCRRV